MEKRFWIIIGVIAAIFVGFLLFNNNREADAPGANTGNSGGSNHVLGKGTKGVTLTEYGDYECAFCRDYYPIVKQVTQKYGDDIKFEFKNYPLTQVHKNAFAAARAAEAANMQGKFWEMHDMLFQNHSAWAEGTGVQNIFQTYASQLGLDTEKFKKDYASSTVNGIINADIAAFNKLGLRKSTPTFLLNGKKIDPKSVEDFSKLIDEAIAKHEQEQKQ